MDYLIREWKAKVNPGIYINQNTMLNTRLFGSDQVVIQMNEEELQRSLHLLHQLCNTYNLKISFRKIKTMAFWGSYPIGTKIVIERYCNGFDQRVARQQLCKYE
jgi:hypothetical protein